MGVKVNLYYNDGMRDFFMDYSLAISIPDPKFKLVLRFVDADHARAFSNFVVAMHPTFFDEKYFPLPFNSVIRFYDKHYNNYPGILRIHIKVPEDVLIMERTVGDWVMPGSRFYCGRCGGILCQASEYMQLPFSLNIFKGRVKNVAYTLNESGLVCGHCKEEMFHKQKDVLFADLLHYFEHQKQISQ